MKIEREKNENETDENMTKLLSYLYAHEMTNGYDNGTLGYDDDVRNAIEEVFTKAEHDSALNRAENLLDKL